ncbi:MAG: SusC/RagA family TonB-linked outer membrane protein [Flavobacterium sp.]|nr:MAG: SusC/RagA family TonB-linked outer membrane protein [Flavobacterium sp.]
MIFRIIFSLLILSIVKVYSQESPRKIPVVDGETLRPISQVTVTIGKKQLQTDENGLFNLDSHDLVDSLVLSHVRYITKSISKQQFYSAPYISMVIKGIELKSVVINTGYQRVNQRLSTGAVEKIDVERLQDIYGTSILQKLEGNSPILFDKNTSRPGMTIRGLSSINNSSLPLIVLDNFPFEGSIDLINPEDIADISILKDAAASAIWGTRAGNGVVVITTKKGKLNSPTKINFTSGLQVQKSPDLYYLNQVSTSGIIDLEKFLFEKGYYGSQERSTSKPFLSPVVEHLIAIRDRKGDDAEHTKAIDALRNLDVREDYKRYMYRDALNRNYNLSFEGGGSTVRYMVSGRFDDNVGTLDQSDKKFVLRSFLEVNLFPKLKLSTDIQYFRTDRKNGKNAYSLTSSRPYMMLADENGDAIAHPKYRAGYLDTVGKGRLLDWFAYPLTEYREQDIRTSLNTLTANFILNYELSKGLNLRADYKYEHTNAENKSHYGANSYTARDLINRYSAINYSNGNVSYGIPMGGIFDQSIATLGGHNLRLGAEYQKDWGNFHLNTLVGTEWRHLQSEGSTNRFYGFDDDNYSMAKVDYINPYKNIINHSTIYVPYIDDKSLTLNRFLSQYMNTSVSYKSRYVLTGSLRRDASNLFGVKTNDKWQPLWSVGYKWSVSDEPFFKISWINQLALRISYGVTGNVDQSRSAITTLRYLGADMFTNLPYAGIIQYKNPELRWEKNKTFNAGLDFSLFRGVIGGSLDYYQKKGNDLFGTAPVDYTAVPSKAIMRNIAAMKGQGIDLNIQANIQITHNILFKPLFTLNINHSEVVDYYRAGNLAHEFLSTGNVINGTIGYPVYSIMAYQWKGLNETGNPLGVLNGETSTDYNNIRIQDKSTLVYGGSVVPTYSGFFNPYLTIGHFDLSAGFIFKMGHVFKRETVRYGELLSMGALGAGSGDYDKRWQNVGDELSTDIPSFVYPVVQNRNHFYENSASLIEKADLIRLQNITFGYRFEIANKIKAKVHVNATDMGLVWKSNKKGIDPDYVTRFKPEKQLSLGIRLNY